MKPCHDQIVGGISCILKIPKTFISMNSKVSDKSKKLIFLMVFSSCWNKKLTRLNFDIWVKNEILEVVKKLPFFLPNEIILVQEIK